MSEATARKRPLWADSLTKKESLEDASSEKAQELLSAKRPAPSAGGEAGRAAAVGTGSGKWARMSALEMRAVSTARSTACTVPLGRRAASGNLKHALAC